MDTRFFIELDDVRSAFDYLLALLSIFLPQNSKVFKYSKPKTCKILSIPAPLLISVLEVDSFSMVLAIDSIFSGDGIAMCLNLSLSRRKSLPLQYYHYAAVAVFDRAASGVLPPCVSSYFLFFWNLASVASSSIRLRQPWLCWLNRVRIFECERIFLLLVLQQWIQGQRALHLFVRVFFGDLQTEFRLLFFCSSFMVENGCKYLCGISAFVSGWFFHNFVVILWLKNNRINIDAT